jgi:hypothetical protein
VSNTGLILGIAAFIVAVVALAIEIRYNEPARDAAAAAAATVLLDGRACPVHTITDKLQGKTWRVIYVDRGAIVIPGSEQPITLEKP